MKRSIWILMILMVATFCLADMVYQNTSGRKTYIGDGEFVEASETTTKPYFIYNDDLQLISVVPDNIILAADKVTDSAGTAATPTYHIAKIAELANTNIEIEVFSGEVILYFSATTTTAVTITDKFSLELNSKWYNKLIFEVSTPTTFNYTITKKF